ncbi:MAG: glycosyltransferase 2 family protein [Verrucomicrobiota bacterium]
MRKVDWGALGAVLTRLHFGWALAGWTFTALIFVGMTLRWQIFLRQQGIFLSFGTVFSLTWAGQFFNSILPGSTGGDVVKIYQLCRLAPDRKAAATATVFVDRLTALLALLALAGISFALDPTPLRILSAGSISPVMLLGGLVVGVILMAAVFWLMFRLFRSTRLAGRVMRTLAAVKENLSLNRGFLAAILLAFAIHLANFTGIYLFARALGISITYPQMLLMMPIVLFLIMLPITINGHGLRELLLIGYFTEMGVTLTGSSSSGVREIALALSLLMVTNDLLWSIPGGIWYLVRFKTMAQPSDPAANSTGE